MDPLFFRKVMGHFATGITVVTTRTEDQVRGMTANALCSVSLDPPLVLVCVDHQAQMHQALSASGVFALNILTEDQEELSRLFAQKDLELGRELMGEPYREGVTGLPLLQGCSAYVECRIVATYPGGDHTIFVGQVEAASASGGKPLIFNQGSYHRLADCP